MVYDHHVKSGGVWYAPGEDVPGPQGQSSESAEQEGQSSESMTERSTTATGKRGSSGRKKSHPEADIEFEM